MIALNSKMLTDRLQKVSTLQIKNFRRAVSNNWKWRDKDYFSSRLNWFSLSFETFYMIVFKVKF